MGLAINAREPQRNKRLWGPEQSDTRRRWDMNRSFDNELDLEEERMGDKGIWEG